MAKDKKIQAIDEVTEDFEAVDSVEVTEEKPYKFRKLASADVFLMFRIISKIGINEFMTALKSDSLKNIIEMFKDKVNYDDKEEEQDNDDLYMMGAIAGTLEIANVIIGNLSKCENEIYQLLSQTSNLTVDEIKAEGNAVMFVEMVIDFIKKDEFPDFIRVASKLFK